MWLVAEGVDGSGKSTLCDHLADELYSRGWTVVYTREPGGLGVPCVLREEALDQRDTMARQLLMAADARINFVRNVQPYLDDPNTVVLQDRGQWSALVYSGLLDPMVESLGHDGTAPDAYLYVRTPPETCYERLSERRWRDQFDSVGRSTLERRQAAYEALVRSSVTPVIFAHGDAVSVASEASFVADTLEKYYLP